jgi:hypothetical protein
MMQTNFIRRKEFEQPDIAIVREGWWFLLESCCVDPVYNEEDDSWDSVTKEKGSQLKKIES